MKNDNKPQDLEAVGVSTQPSGTPFEFHIRAPRSPVYTNRPDTPNGKVFVRKDYAHRYSKINWKDLTYEAAIQKAFEGSSDDVINKAHKARVRRFHKFLDQWDFFKPQQNPHPHGNVSSGSYAIEELGNMDLTCLVGQELLEDGEYFIAEYCHYLQHVEGVNANGVYNAKSTLLKIRDCFSKGMLEDLLPADFQPALNYCFSVYGIDKTFIRDHFGQVVEGWTRKKVRPRRGDGLTQIQELEDYFNLPRNTLFDKLTWGTGREEDAQRRAEEKIAGPAEAGLGKKLSDTWHRILKAEAASRSDRYAALEGIYYSSSEKFNKAFKEGVRNPSLTEDWNGFVEHKKKKQLVDHKTNAFVTLKDSEYWGSDKSEKTYFNAFSRFFYCLQLPTPAQLELIPEKEWDSMESHERIMWCKQNLNLIDQCHIGVFGFRFEDLSFRQLFDEDCLQFFYQWSAIKSYNEEAYVLEVNRLKLAKNGQAAPSDYQEKLLGLDMKASRTFIDNFNIGLNNMCNSGYCYFVQKASRFQKLFDFTGSRKEFAVHCESVLSKSFLANRRTHCSNNLVAKSGEKADRDESIEAFEKGTGYEHAYDAMLYILDTAKNKYKPRRTGSRFEKIKGEITPAEVDAGFDGIPDLTHKRRLCALALVVNTAFRIEQLTNLKIDHEGRTGLHKRGGSWWVSQPKALFKNSIHKHAQDWEIELSPISVALLEEYLTAREGYLRIHGKDDTGELFIKTPGGNGLREDYGIALPVVSMREDLKAIQREVFPGVPPIDAHSFRRVVAIKMAIGGATPAEIALFLNDSVEVAMGIYAVVRARYLKTGVSSRIVSMMSGYKPR